MGYGGLCRQHRLTLYAIALYYADMLASLKHYPWIVWELAPEYTKETYLDRADRYGETTGVNKNAEDIIRSINIVLDY